MYTVSASILALVIVVGALHAAPVYGGTSQPHAIHGFVEMLIEKNIVPSHLASKARAFAAMITRADTTVSEPTHARNANSVDVRISQLIQHADLTYSPGENIDGLLVLVTNTTGEEVVLEAVRKCQVVYRIYRGHELLYDSAAKDICQTDERVTYRLGAHDTRMFEVTHPATAKPLSPGVYRVELEYPGYGAGERTITIE
jgi:hypothetical protein